jgi:hypothetical protein
MREYRRLFWQSPTRNARSLRVTADEARSSKALKKDHDPLQLRVIPTEQQYWWNALS